MMSRKEGRISRKEGSKDGRREAIKERNDVKEGGGSLYPFVAPVRVPSCPLKTCLLAYFVPVLPITTKLNLN
jgi:hypothetical protein